MGGSDQLTAALEMTSRASREILAAPNASAIDAAAGAALAELDRAALPAPAAAAAREQLESVKAAALGRVELDARLASALRARELLLAGVSHDLRNPLNTFAMSAGLLRDDVERGEVERARDLGLLQRMERAIEKMQRLIEDLVEASRLEARKIAITPRPEAVGVLVGAAVEAASAVAAERGVALAADEIPSALSVLVDRARVVQTFTKLVAYSVRVIGDGGTVRVSASERDGAVAISLRASPAGSSPLPPHEEGRGGLALLLARGLVDLHAGDLRVHHGEALLIDIALPRAA